MAAKNTPTALYTSLSAAQALAGTNQFVEAEVKYQEALRQATKDFGPESDQVVLVLSILAAFYHSQNRHQEAIPLDTRLAEWTMRSQPKVVEQPEKKFVGSNRSHSDLPSQDAGVRIPGSLRHACQILGIPMDSQLTAALVNQAWKKQMLSAAAHPDLGGNTDEAVLLNNAKIEMMSFLESCAPKLGAKFKKD
ncbi:MAG: tetratricopeptide repeat protein [Cyanobacteria bacterium SZAS LIN-2]|nr:tetratricopeptide repeat protein [Cyanobacteria bacterium SZAS LIN-3]MBS1995638.1 tetratricopeptide repeat protein [Cyanobacteria bacterium SZAS LIN-2]MBS2009491.1 tetratricopeptide repeat protein [Cyanobacteria bacterium SZAS TMP-1]